MKKKYRISFKSKNGIFHIRRQGFMISHAAWHWLAGIDVQPQGDRAGSGQKVCARITAISSLCRPATYVDLRDILAETTASTIVICTPICVASPSIGIPTSRLIHGSLINGILMIVVVGGCKAHVIAPKLLSKCTAKSKGNVCVDRPLTLVSIW